MSRTKSLTFDAAMQKLSDTAKAVSQREGVKPHQQRRAEEALTLLANGTAFKPMGVKSESTYLSFLQKVHKVAGLSMVVLCAIALGKSAIGFLRESIRLDLPFEIQKKLATLDNEFLQRLAEGYPEKCEADCIGFREIAAKTLHS